jgi:hypothetical protein
MNCYLNLCYFFFFFFNDQLTRTILMGPEPHTFPFFAKREPHTSFALSSNCLFFLFTISLFYFIFVFSWSTY